jgi:Domain of unknown function (DUF4399)
VKTAIAVMMLGLLTGTGWPVVAGTQARPATVQITSPKNGATVSNPVTITLVATGVRIAAASDQSKGSTHHHLFVDRDLNWLSDTIPQGSPGIIHLAGGQTEFVLDSLKPGPHRVIALLARWDHVPIYPLIADTVVFTVK